jgi:Icc-related predicted phosphoesterase
MKKVIWHFSDSHTNHEQLSIPEGVDIAIFSGDCSNPREPIVNEPQVRDFIIWFSKLPIPYKIFVAGNHDVSIEKGLVTRQDFYDAGIIYLENEYATIDGIRIFGSPNQPTFGKGWAFNIPKDQMNDLWKSVEQVDILITHGAPKGILDYVYKREGNLEACGCLYLRKHVLKRIKPKLCLFGHIHNNKDLINAGTTKLSISETIFSNGSVVTDNVFGEISSNGNILILEYESTETGSGTDRKELEGQGIH